LSFRLEGGEFSLDEERSQRAQGKLAKEMSRVARRNVDVIEAAQGVLDVVNSNMERALRRISIERGYDSRGFALLPFGGAGGLHAVDLAQALRIPEVIVPTSAGALSATGVLTADVVRDQSRTLMIDLRSGIGPELERSFRAMEKDADSTLRDEGFPKDRQRHERSLALRYQGQSFELNIPYATKNLAARFHRAHRQLYGYAQESSVIEVVSARLRSSGLVERIPQRRLGKTANKVAKPVRFVEAYFDGEKVRTGVYERERLNAGDVLRAPCIVVEYSSTTLIPAEVFRYGGSADGRHDHSPRRAGRRRRGRHGGAGRLAGPGMGGALRQVLTCQIARESARRKIGCARSPRGPPRKNLTCQIASQSARTPRRVPDCLLDLWL